MTRRSVVLLPLLVTACARPPKNFAAILPEQLDGWTRGEISAARDMTPSLVTQAGPEDSALTVYASGARRIEVMAFRMKAETSAFELRQKWRQDQGLATYQGPYFFVAKPAGDVASADAMALLSAIQKAAAQ